MGVGDAKRSKSPVVRCYAVSANSSFQQWAAGIIFFAHHQKCPTQSTRALQDFSWKPSRRIPQPCLPREDDSWNDRDEPLEMAYCGKQRVPSLLEMSLEYFARNRALSTADARVSSFRICCFVVSYAPPSSTALAGR